jgi:membrane protein
MKSRSLRTIIRRTVSDWNDHDAPRLGAALAFYMILSLAPLVLITLQLAAFAFGRSASQSDILNQVETVMGPDGANVVRALMKNAQGPSSGGIASAFGLITLLFGASGVFVELRSALNTIWGARSESSGGFKSLLEERIFSFGMLLAIGLFVFASLALDASVAAVGKFFNELLPIPEIFLSILNSALSLVTISVLFALIFKYVPITRTPWKEAWIGGTVSAFLFTVGNALIGLYLGKAGIGSAYGAAGSLIAIIVWAYYSAQVFFFGAEFTHVLVESNRPAS